MNIATYQINFHNALGRSVLGTLSYSIRENGALAPGGLAELAALDVQGGTVEFSTFVVDGTLSAPQIVGVNPLKVSGVMYVSLMGPPLATLLTGTNANSFVSMEFNLIDSPGQYIGGGMSLQSEGGQGAMEPWCFLGTAS